jgi:hypothetical protein
MDQLTLFGLLAVTAMLIFICTRFLLENPREAAWAAVCDTMRHLLKRRHGIPIC